MIRVLFVITDQLRVTLLEREFDAALRRAIEVMDAEAEVIRQKIHELAKPDWHNYVMRLHLIVPNPLMAIEEVQKYLDSVARKIASPWTPERSRVHRFTSGKKCMLYVAHRLSRKWIDCVVVDTQATDAALVLKYATRAREENWEPYFPKSAVLLLCDKEQVPQFSAEGWKCADRNDLEEMKHLVKAVAECIISREE
ncbi:MAG: hypothetical protein COT39_01650 [Parcubacteria group bacterium CG08_land_8_20_14_0_20_48_21]|nr:MAG: hypothetical protein AUK21_00060 [Parcubacteria group bacterium CG2_30_48_51]PIS32983.1 MAG: hypothetical protein COT39_01650 [Parcubacteria group bacterium CG08_land_8_20_14_0_20_48_21]PIW78904.1 MAG: hypothetical protein COZ99_03900 [Parcubacteria group bacterium CG_4_8_14_3_um_filter_48_16]PIY77724.1 MAG: hypothetical protein COY83_03680 [Parcubacteria group bacterium CG_4_10_14_0_8_um_filter_48_154]PIZ77748.1 MAG: hypothetical protein COY03_01735 [bacterium CG_4_10_14_0_2_um_filter_